MSRDDGDLDLAIPHGPKAEALFDRIDWPALTFAPPPRLALPPRAFKPCEDCRGRGVQHSCPDCDCPCPECGSTGHFDLDEGISVDLLGCPVAMVVARKVLALHVINLTIGPVVRAGANWPFLFDGGEGVFATCHKPADAPNHLTLEIEP
jgi:hypothetical protein